MSETVNAPFVFGYQEILALAKPYDRFGASHTDFRVTVGLTGYEIFRFSQDLKGKLEADFNQKVKELEAEIVALKAQLLLATGTALVALGAQSV